MESEYTTPKVVMQSSPMLIVLGIVLPIVLTFLISYFSVSKKLKFTPLSLLRGDDSVKMPSKA